jgi:hypothetical protein
MQQALKTSSTEDLDEFLKRWTDEAATRDRKAPSSRDNDVVRPSFSKKTSAFNLRLQQKPELSAALATVEKAGKLIETAQERALLAEEQFRETEEHTSKRLNAVEIQLRKAQERSRIAEERLNSEKASVAEKAAKADAQFLAAQEEAKRQEERADALEQHAKNQILQTQALLKDANDGLCAAETRALQFEEDLAYLKNYIIEHLALGPVSSRVVLELGDQAASRRKSVGNGADHMAQT